SEPINEAITPLQQGKGSVGSFLLNVVVFVAGLGLGLMGLVYFERWFIRRPKEQARVKNKEGEIALVAPEALALMIAIGIGLHNFSEGLAIGQSAASGAIQLAAVLIIGFGLHNMTEGFGIAAPLARGSASRLCCRIWHGSDCDLVWPLTHRKSNKKATGLVSVLHRHEESAPNVVLRVCYQFCYHLCSRQHCHLDTFSTGNLVQRFTGR